MKALRRTFYRRADGVLMTRGEDGRVRAATLKESAAQPVRSSWWNRVRSRSHTR